MKNLGKAKKGIYYQVEGISDKASQKIKRRLMELGFFEGQKVRLVRRSLLGKAYLIEVRGYMLSMRKSLASFVLLRGEND